MNIKSTMENNSPQADRLERVRLYLKLHGRQFVTQGSVVAGWRQSGGRRFGPYYRLVHCQDGRQRSLYLGKSEWLVEEVRKLLAIMRRPLREARAYQRLLAGARAGLRQAKAELRQQLARFGLLLKGFEIRGLDALRHVSRWGQLARQRGVPCPRFMPLLELGDVPLSLPGRRWRAPFVPSTLRAVPANGACHLFPAWRQILGQNSSPGPGGRA